MMRCITSARNPKKQLKTVFRILGSDFEIHPKESSSRFGGAFASTFEAGGRVVRKKSPQADLCERARMGETGLLRRRGRIP